ncbi:hypothetical protein FHS14_001825 [Paenibacillus baekrokdamisoli]|nr:hypothetical protein [Paenibacillus baekrokdamisoli]
MNKPSYCLMSGAVSRNLRFSSKTIININYCLVYKLLFYYDNIVDFFHILSDTH